jgi:hypothetical protein
MTAAKALTEGQTEGHIAAAISGWACGLDQLVIYTNPRFPRHRQRPKGGTVRSVAQRPEGLRPGRTGPRGRRSSLGVSSDIDNRRWF